MIMSLLSNHDYISKSNDMKSRSKDERRSARERGGDGKIRYNRTADDDDEALKRTRSLPEMGTGKLAVRWLASIS